MVALEVRERFSARRLPPTYGHTMNKLDGFASWEQPYEAMSAMPQTRSDFASESSRAVVVGLLSVLGLISLGAAAD